ncbi:MAG: dTMP kinase [Candidatus Komeilibacteria bacterium]|nr:dTMP kinase [Candidatus Komeilibacteria bacterium]
MTRKGVFINFEGIDGCGKDTQISLLTAKLQNAGKQFFVGLEPTYDSEYGLRIRRILRHEEAAPSATEMQQLYVHDRHWHVDRFIKPNLSAGAIVVENRYMFSTFAFGKAFGVDYELMKKWHADLPVPDLTFYLRLPASEAVTRIKGRGKGVDYFEKQEKLEKIASAYDQVLSDWKGIKIVDGSQSIDVIHHQVWEEVRGVLDL